MIDRIDELRAVPAQGSRALQMSPASSSARLGGLRTPLRSPMPSPPSTPQLRNRQETALEAFLSQVESIRGGPLRELEQLHQEAKVQHTLALRATTAKNEREALARAESCADRATAAASRACKALQALGAEVRGAPPDSTEATLRKQSFAGVSVMFQNAMNAYFQAQQAFRTEMETKVSRQLRAAFPEATDAAVAAVAAGQSAASAIEDTIRLQQGTGPLSTATALKASRANMDELKELQRSVFQLKQTFLGFQSLVDSQGEVIDDIERHMATTRDRTRQAQEELERAHASRRACRARWIVTLCILVIAGAIALVAYEELRH